MYEARLEKVEGVHVAKDAMVAHSFRSEGQSSMEPMMRFGGIAGSL